MMYILITLAMVFLVIFCFSFLSQPKSDFNLRDKEENRFYDYNDQF